VQQNIEDYECVLDRRCAWIYVCWT